MRRPCVPPSDPAAALRLLYRQAFDQQMRLATAMLTAPWLAWQGGGAPAPTVAPPAVSQDLPTAEPQAVPAAEPQAVPMAPETPPRPTPRRRAARPAPAPIVLPTAETEDAEDIP